MKGQAELSASDVGALKAYKGTLDEATKFIPTWVKVVSRLLLALAPWSAGSALS